MRKKADSKEGKKLSVAGAVALARSKSGGKTQSASKAEEALLGLKKQYLKSKPVCKVTFCLPKEAAPDANEVIVAGDFNGWDMMSTHMKKQKNGGFAVTLELEPGREYRFRYLIDGARWENDWRADRYEPNPHGGDNSVVVT